MLWKVRARSHKATSTASAMREFCSSPSPCSLLNTTADGPRQGHYTAQISGTLETSGSWIVGQEMNLPLDISIQNWCHWSWEQNFLIAVRLWKDSGLKLSNLWLLACVVSRRQIYASGRVLSWCHRPLRSDRASPNFAILFSACLFLVGHVPVRHLTRVPLDRVALAHEPDLGCPDILASGLFFLDCDLNVPNRGCFVEMQNYLNWN